MDIKTLTLILLSTPKIEKIYVVNRIERSTDSFGDHIEKTVFRAYRNRQEAEAEANARTERECSSGMDIGDGDIWYTVTETELY